MPDDDVLTNDRKNFTVTIRVDGADSYDAARLAYRQLGGFLRKARPWWRRLLTAVVYICCVGGGLLIGNYGIWTSNPAHIGSGCFLLLLALLNQMEWD